MSIMTLPLHALHASATPAAADEDLDLRLLDQFRIHGDREALERLLVRHAAVAYRVARRLCAADSDAMDAVQDGMLQVMMCAQQFRTPGSVRSWLLAVVANSCRRRVRADHRRARRERLAAPAPAPSPAQATLDDQERQALRIELERLPERYRLPISLRIIDGLSFAEISSILQRREKTVRSQVDRGLSRLRAALQGRGLALSLSALASLRTDTAPSPGMIDRLRVSAREQPLPLPATSLATGSGILIASGLLLAAAAVTLAGERMAHRVPVTGGTSLGNAGGVSTTAPALQGTLPGTAQVMAGSGAGQTTTRPDPATSIAAVSGVVASIRPDAQGRQDLVVLTIPPLRTADVGHEFIIDRGVAYIVKVRVERQLPGMLVCRVMPETWNRHQLAITQGDSATIIIASPAQHPALVPTTRDQTRTW